MYFISYTSRDGEDRAKAARPTHCMGPNTVISARPLGVGGCQWFATVGGLGRQRLRVLVPRPVGWGRGTPEFWQYDRKREAAAGAAALGSRLWSPPPALQRIIIT